MMIGYHVTCFHDMLTYKLIQYDKTSQRVINIINMEKTFAPNNFAQKQKN